MKNTVLIISIALLSVACGGSDDDPKVNAAQTVIDGLNKTWSVNSVMFDSVEETADWNGFTLKFDQSKGYTASRLSDESVLVWPTSGSYSFPDESNPNAILRSDGVAVTVFNLTETTATLTFTISGRSDNSGGKVKGLEGEWVFELGN